MTERGDATRERLLAATRAVVRSRGYARATTRAVAREAGVTEATIYRHFPDKAALLFAAAMAGHEDVVAELSTLPARAGDGDVAANLVAALTRLAELQDEVLPLELAIRADADLAASRAAAAAAVGPGLAGPPVFVVQYVQAEQRLGRIRADVPAAVVTKTLLGLLLGVAMDPTRAPGAPLAGDVATMVDLLVTGLTPRPRG